MNLTLSTRNYCTRLGLPVSMFSLVENYANVLVKRGVPRTGAETAAAYMYFLRMNGERF